MRAVAQRVLRAAIRVGEETVGEMGTGILALVGVGREDDADAARELARRLVSLRIFEDAAGRMNRSLPEVGGTLGVVSQFTLFGDTRRGRRPSFGTAAPADRAEPLVAELVAEADRLGVPVTCGRFRAHMRVELVNDGPVTLLLDTEKRF